MHVSLCREIEIPIRAKYKKLFGFRGLSHKQVYVAVNQWKQLLPAKEQVRSNNYRASHPEGDRAFGADNRAPSTQALTAATADSDDDIVMGEKLTLDQVIEVKSLLIVTLLTIQPYLHIVKHAGAPLI